MKHVRIFVFVIASIALLGVAGWYYAVFSAQKAFESSAREGNFRQILDVVEASLGSSLARSDSPMQTGRADKPVGALDYYQKNPRNLQRDKKYFETWHSALAIAHSGLENGHQLTGWESSTGVTWIPPSQRADSWGHAFCVQSDQQRAIVVSPGPQAVSSLDCSTLKLPEGEVPRMPQGRLTPHDSGALILVVKRSAQTPVAH